MKVILMMQNMAVMVHLIGVKRLAVATSEMVAAAMKKRTRRGFCCCRSCKRIFDTEAVMAIVVAVLIGLFARLLG